jgi:hypothetical protein
MKVPGGTQVTETFVLAISGDMGKTWTFFDVTMADKNRIKMLLPDFNENLKIPERKESQFIPDKPAAGDR